MHRVCREYFGLTCFFWRIQISVWIFHLPCSQLFVAANLQNKYDAERIRVQASWPPTSSSSWNVHNRRVWICHIWVTESWCWRCASASTSNEVQIFSFFTPFRFWAELFGFFWQYLEINITIIIINYSLVRDGHKSCCLVKSMFSARNNML